MQELLRELNVYQHLLAIAMGTPRLFSMCFVAPFFGPSVVTGQIRTVLVFSLYMILHPLVQAQMQTQLPAEMPGTAVELAFLGLLLGKEILLGFMIGWLASIPFWAAQSGGFFIDNQRGASMAESSDALSGEQTSPLGILFLQSVVYLFFVSGAFLAFMGLVYSSYLVWPVGKLIPQLSREATLLFAEETGWLMSQMLLLAGPIAVACLLIDLSLGLMNRFASQLNVYVLAMPIKSGVAALILLVYVGMLALNTPPMYLHIRLIVQRLQGMLS